MDNEVKSTNNQSLKIQLSLASLMFFSPFVQHLLKNNNFELSQDDYFFIKGYLSLGIINIWLLLFVLITWLLAYYTTLPLVHLLYQVGIGILIFLLTLGSIWAITETTIGTPTPQSRQKSDKARILLTYLPGYSLYLRYNDHNFDNPNMILKESLILWILFGISCFIPNPLFPVIIAIAILIRIVSLLGNIHIIPMKISEFLSSLFYKNPEELWSYIWGSILFLFHRNYTLSYWKLLIETTKKEYQYLYDIKKFGTIQRQYWLFIVGIVLFVWQVDLWHIPWLAILSLLLVVGRYGIMVFIWGRSPALPLMRELVTLITPFISKK